MEPVQLDKHTGIYTLPKRELQKQIDKKKKKARKYLFPSREILDEAEMISEQQRL